MSDTLGRAVAIEESLRRPEGELPAVAEIDAALVALHGLPVADPSDAVVVRDTVSGIVQMRAAVLALRQAQAAE